ncbi:hypothetical protein SAMN05421788_1011455 [Filimonas lacunae]|uniref:Nucleotidyltransferase n=1 Tax=Filimonas lacunae TaxID=477680 RepID=A0A173MR95_9BACT|nr:nucleotidyltransferase domain-containing protein [Filimonas lacunae]BAV10026.1 hypothetical protein FLA_6080 [Filimonas lacunae]SIS82762.1 hypothetical protein SAMN05421788_1011455 [Filimonas lacunae]
MRNRIEQKLKDIEREYQVKILYSCESGSRAWQFPSPDSDFDVRFIYVHNRNAYWSIAEKEDHISLPIVDELDIYGWDLRKVLQLMRKSNATPFEWMQSPIVYKEKEGFLDGLHNLAPDYLDVRVSACHYMGMVRKLTGEEMTGAPLTIKALFYIIRSLLSAKWNLDTRGIAPLTIDDLLCILPEALQQHVKELVLFKATAKEKQEVAASDLLKNYINATIAECNAAISGLEKRNTSVDKLDAFFIKTLQEYDYSGIER